MMIIQCFFHHPVSKTCGSGDIFCVPRKEGSGSKTLLKKTFLFFFALFFWRISFFLFCNYYYFFVSLHPKYRKFDVSWFWRARAQTFLFYVSGSGCHGQLKTWASKLGLSHGSILSAQETAAEEEDKMEKNVEQQQIPLKFILPKINSFLFNAIWHPNSSASVAPSSDQRRLVSIDQQNVDSSNLKNKSSRTKEPLRSSQSTRYYSRDLINLSADVSSGQASADFVDTGSLRAIWRESSKYINTYN